jgi:hypothetical protein
MFIVAVVQHIKIGDLSQGGVFLSGDEPGYSTSSADDIDHLPGGIEVGDTRLSKSDEYSLVRESTSGFAGENVQLGTCKLNEVPFRLARLFIPPRVCPVRKSTGRGR